MSWKSPRWLLGLSLREKVRRKPCHFGCGADFRRAEPQKSSGLLEGVTSLLRRYGFFKGQYSECGACRSYLGRKFWVPAGRPTQREDAKDPKIFSPLKREKLYRVNLTSAGVWNKTPKVSSPWENVKAVTKPWKRNRSGKGKSRTKGHDLTKVL